MKTGFLDIPPPSGFTVEYAIWWKYNQRSHTGFLYRAGIDFSRSSIEVHTTVKWARAPSFIYASPYMYVILINLMAHGTWRFNAAFMRALQWSLSWAESTQFHVLITISLGSILIWSSQLCVGLPKGLLPVGLKRFKNVIYSAQLPGEP